MLINGRELGSFRALLSRAVLLIFETFCIAVTAFAVLFTAYNAGPIVERWVAPVISRLQIIKAEFDTKTSTNIWVQFTKHRDCEFIGIIWFKQDDLGVLERVRVEFPERSGNPTRPRGFQRAGPWKIEVSLEELYGHSFARIYHRCHGFWISISELWP